MIKKRKKKKKAQWTSGKLGLAVVMNYCKCYRNKAIILKYKCIANDFPREAYGKSGGDCQWSGIISIITDRIFLPMNKNVFLSLVMFYFVRVSEVQGSGIKYQVMKYLMQDGR